ncbi:MAG TPA: chemotaxis protein CheW [Terriglobales bacterium]|nr:chemotaxis protein CheW [Terriglobales bacterium]
MDEIVKDFLIESGENLDRLDQELVKLESDPRAKELLASIFRTIHTIKGSAGFLGFLRLQRVAHAGENLLSRLRDGVLALTGEVTSGLLAMVDAVRNMLSEIQATEHDGENDYPELLELLQRLQETAAAGAPAKFPPEAGKPAASLVPEIVVRKNNVPAAVVPEVVVPVISVPTVAAPAVEAPVAAAKREAQPAEPAAPVHRPVAGKLGGLLVESGRVRAEDLTHALAEQEHGDQRRLGEILVALGLCKQEDILAALQTIEVRGRETGVETVRVGVNLLDKLMTLVGELVLARNQLLQFSGRTSDAGVNAISQRMNLIASELQEEVMKTRMQPIGNTWSKFPRTVRDLALSCGKEVRLEMEGQDTELDRTIIEAVKDPLTHLVRNSVDHGIESPDARRRAGKPAGGRLSLRAFHEGGQVNIEISDDGAGLDRERIRSKALERGVISSDQAARMSEHEIFRLIFLPGFSTAEKVTNVSGRGVGMDVVRTNLEKIGGTVDLQSVAGKGTTVRIKIPLTLAIIPALIVASAGDRFAIPQVNLLELVRLEGEEVAKRIEKVHGVPVHRLRGRLLPLVYLNRELRLAETGGGGDGAVNIVVLQADKRQFGLIVDRIIDSEEIVVKPLRKQLKTVKTFAGSSIMGDGRVALILDVVGLAQRASVIAETQQDHGGAEKSALAEAAAEKRRFLLFAGPGGSRMAVPLDTLERLEELPSSQVERAGTHWVAQYRDQILPLVNLEFALEERRRQRQQAKFMANASSAPLQVLVCRHEGRTVGLVVEQILDIVEDAAELKYPASRPGVLYSTVIQERVTELIDVPAILSGAGLGLAGPNPAEGDSAKARSAAASAAEAEN